MVTKKKTDPARVIGTPTMLLLPARNYRFKVNSKTHSIIVPRRGKYVDLDSKAFKKRDGEFDLLQYSEEDDSHVLYIPALSKVLFAANKYPDLEDAEAFTPLAIIVREDEVEVVGNVIEMVKEE